MSLERALRTAYVAKEVWEFVPPPEAPTFSPTEEEFADPLAYIARIRPTAERYGICKIRPPPGWQPPFALDVDSLRFVPRVQKLSELEGVTRLRRHFDDRLCRYWEMRGAPVDAPEHDGKRVDLFALYHTVGFEGGYAKCERNNYWPKIAAFMDMNQSTQAPTALRQAYLRFLLPFERTLKEPPSPQDSKPQKAEPTDKIEPTEPTPTRPRERRFRKSKTGSEIQFNCPSTSKSRELRRLAWYGAGPKACVPIETDESTPLPPRKRSKTEDRDDEIVECSVCSKSDPSILTCRECGENCHPGCVDPQSFMTCASTKRWYCALCIAREAKKPVEAFGFAQADSEYSLVDFGTKADNFKRSHFDMPPRNVPSILVEKEFWRILSSAEENVTVEYGADLHSMDHGSGFPTGKCKNLHPDEREYRDSGWNLNNLPGLPGSVLRFVNGDISGMTVPWMYVGMCFSSFCWHNEDHWSYSINFLHWGDVKTWYGVPGAAAERLETVMKYITPELFETQPDLLHQLVTILNPNVLTEAEVPVYRLDQAAGEFVITFPRAYHAGFNQGYNFAEAVNFAPTDWLPVGRDCILHYKSLRRFCVFSHDELICKIGVDAADLDLAIAIPTYKELVCIVMAETEGRRELTERGVRRATKRDFCRYEDDHRLCEVCKTTCFLSALICEKCRIMVCLDHAKAICECPPDTLVLHYHYKLDELHSMLQELKARIQTYDKWMTEVKKLLSPDAPFRSNQMQANQLLREAKDLKINKCTLLDRLIDKYGKVNQSGDEIIEVIEIPD